MHNAFEAEWWMSNFQDCTLGLIKIILELYCLDTVHTFHYFLRFSEKKTLAYVI